MYVVTLPIEAASNPASFAHRAKEAGVNLLEICGDLTPNVSKFESPLPLIISPRHKGYALLDLPNIAYVDLEFGEEHALPKGTKRICSFHDYAHTPSVQEFAAIFSKARDEKPDIIKLAVTIQSYADMQVLNTLHEILPQDQGLVILGMGIKAYLNRSFSPFQNALTYTYLDDGQHIVHGQIPFVVHKLTAHCKNPRMFGLIGDLNTTSFSPLIHNTLFARNDIDALYTLFLTDDLDDAYDNLTAQGVAGFSVTSPFKQTIIKKLDRVDENAKKIGTVNTVVCEGTKYVGYARDTHGLIEGYSFLKEAESIAILGSGGVVPSVIEACQLSGAKDIRIFARNQENSEELASKFSVQNDDLSSLSSFNPDVLINAISEDIALTLPKAGVHAIDLRYGDETRFQIEAKNAGYTVHNGLSMLLHQAIAQFRLFTGSEPSPESVQEVFSLLHHGK